MEVNSVKPFPNFLVVGAAKCGSTSLYHYLKQHPAVYMSPLKEPNHFSTDIQPADFSPEYVQHEKLKNLDVKKYVNSDMRDDQWGGYIHDREDYIKLFRFAVDKKAIGEISNSYMYSEVAASNIHAEFPGMKIVMILRQPAERAYSHYLANLRDGKTARGFREEIEYDDAKPEHGWGISHLYYELGLYAAQVKRYLELFPANQVKILLFDDLKNNNERLMKDLFRFLDLQPDTGINYKERFNEARIPKSAKLMKFISDTGLKRKIYRALPVAIREKVKNAFFNPGKVPSMSAADRLWLTKRYRNDIIELSALIKKDLSHWLQ
jgi:hypothetical protein